MKNELQEAAYEMMEINGYYQDIMAILGDQEGVELLDNTLIPKGGFSTEEKLSRIYKLTESIGKITARWL